MASDQPTANATETRVPIRLAIALAASLAASALRPTPVVSETILETASTNGELRVTVSVEPFPVTCAHPLVMTVSAVTPAGHVVDFGDRPTGAEHLELTSFSRTTALSADGRTVMHSQRIAWLANLPGQTCVSGRTLVATGPDGRCSSVTMPVTPIEVTATIPNNADPDLRDIAPLPAPPARPWNGLIVTGILLLLTITVLGLAGSPLRHIRRSRRSVSNKAMPS